MISFTKEATFRLVLLILLHSASSKAGFLGWDVAPFLDNRLLDLSGVGSGSCTDFLGDINTLLSWGQLGNQLGDVLASSLGLQGTLFLGRVRNNSLNLFVTLLCSWRKSTARWSTEFSWFLGTTSDGGVLLDILLGDVADLFRPLGTFSVGGIARSIIHTLLFHLSSTLNNIILDIMNFLFCPTLRLIFSSTDLRALNITILYKRSSANFDSLVEGNLFVLNEASFSEILLTLFLLLRLVVGDIGGVTSLVVAVVTLDNIVVLSLGDHLDLVNTSLAIIAGPGPGHIIEAWWSISSGWLTLTLVTTCQRLRRDAVVSVMISVTMMMVLGTASVERECVDKRLPVSFHIIGS